MNYKEFKSKAIYNNPHWVIETVHGRLKSATRKGLYQLYKQLETNLELDNAK